jgi:sugar-specific transcriptional regulator TrmB
MRKKDPFFEKPYFLLRTIKGLNRQGKGKMIGQEHIQTLKGFGLSGLQAKTYLTLLELGEADTKTIAQASNVARQEIYRVMPSLQELGLGKKRMGKPAHFKATPLEDALEILIKKEKEKINRLEDKHSRLIANLQNESTDIFSAVEAQFIVTSKFVPFFDSHEKLLAQTKEKIDIMVPAIGLDRFSKSWAQLKKLMKKRRDLKVRVVIQKVEEDNSLPKLILDYPDFELRYAPKDVTFGMYIFDQRELTLSIAENNGLPSLWSNNPNLVILAENYYKQMWEKATEA